MSYWSVLVPTGIAESNLVTNPSVEVDTTGYSAIASAIARVTTKQRRGAACLQITPTSNAYDGAFFGTVSLTSGQSYTFSVDVWGVLGVPYVIYFGTTGGTVKGTTLFTGIGDWQRVVVTWMADATANFRLYSAKNNSASTGVFYIDGLLCLHAAYDVSYIDGDQQDCTWLAGAHASTSSRDAQSRAGGREINFDSYGVTVKQEAGIGMPPARHLVQKQPLLPGGKFQGRKVLSRTIDLTLGVAGGGTFAGLHSLRKDLVDAFKPDLVKDDQPFILRYTGANSAKALEIAAVYDSGLEYNETDWTYEEIQLRLIAYDDPFWYEEGNAAAQLIALTQDLTNADYILSKINETWAKLGTGLNQRAEDIVIAADGSIYVGGAFTLAGGVANTARITKWNGSVWSPLSTGMDNVVNCLALAPNGDLYAGGYFHTAGGTTVNHIAKWDGSAWSALGTTGTNGDVWCMVFDHNGNLYVGGDFTTAGGVTVDRIAKWDGSTWSALATGTNNRVESLCVASNNVLYIGGMFTTIGAVSAASIAKWNGAAFSALGSGLTGSTPHCLSLVFGNDGVLFAGGLFNAAGGVTVANIAKWNGSAWSALGSGVNNEVEDLQFDEFGMLWVSGYFTSAGGITTAQGVALWNGSSWMPIDVTLPGTPVAWTIAIKASRIYLGYNTSGTAKASVATAITNAGTCTAYPVIHLKNLTAAGIRIFWLKNETSGITLWFNYTIQAGEELVIDLRPGKRSCISTYFGSVWRAFLRSSDIGNFYLLPGVNQITAWGETGLTAWMEYRVSHWAADGAAL